MAKQVEKFVSESDWEYFRTKGYLRVRGAFAGSDLEELTTAVTGLLEKYPHGFVHTPPYSKIKPLPRSEAPKPTDFTPTIIIPHIGFLDPRILKPLANPALHDVLERIVGKDFYLSHTWFQMVPPGTGRLSYHKDRRGSINFNILLDDIGPKMGSTCLIPGSHINTPPPAFCMDDMRLSRSDEIDMTGNAGDLVFFSSEAWHGRSENNSSRWTRRLFFNFFSRSSRDTTAWSGVIEDAQIEAAKTVIPSAYHHMFEIDCRRSKELATVTGSPYRRFALGKSSSNAFFRDVAFASVVYGRDPRSPRGDGHLLPYTTGLVNGDKFSAIKYLSHMRPKPALKVAARAIVDKLHSSPASRHQGAE